jgi:uncharacterized protein YeaO (DUF488 family)
MEIELMRSYDLAGVKKTSPRFLIDRLWPRGLTKESLQLDRWVKELSPSNELRKWYHANAAAGPFDPKKWTAFKERYFGELDKNNEAVNQFIAQIKGYRKIAFIYSSAEREANNATALKEYLSALL